MTTTNRLKRELFKALIETDETFNFDKVNIVDFLEEIWDLRSIPSEDIRFDNAYGDINQHMVSNNDWTFTHLFIDRLKLLESDEKYIKFLNTILLPKYRNEKVDKIIYYVNIINSYVESENLKAILVSYDKDGFPIYEIQNRQEVVDFPIDIKLNNIPFFIEKNISGRGDRKINEIEKLELYKNNKSPFFVLLFEPNWNDFSIKSKFYLYFCNVEINFIGPVKIIKDDKTDDISEVLNEKFYLLSEDFCSLGQSIEYYTNLRKHLKNDFDSIVYALKDAAIFSSIHERFEKRSYFRNSLIREDVAERLIREVRYILNGNDMSKAYSFLYRFKPVFSKEESKYVEIDFDFDNTGDVPSRIYALIGKNGTGKTQLLTSLPIDISNKKVAAFIPNTPLFSKVIAVSYSLFDRFKTPQKTANFNYVYCGLRTDLGGFMTETDLVTRFHSTYSKIVEQSRVRKWRKILLTFIDNETVDEFLKLNSDETDYWIDTGDFEKVRKKLSSGQGIVLYIISEIIANVRLDSLIIYDEPETHLHPNAISQLMNTIYELVNEFESYCIIATHSPLIVRELLSRNVYVIDKSGNDSIVRRIGIESFGENLSSITDEIFENKDIKKQSKTILKRLVNEGKSFEEIVNIIEFDEVPLSLNARILVKSLIKERNEER